PGQPEGNHRDQEHYKGNQEQECKGEGEAQEDSPAPDPANALADLLPCARDLRAHETDDASHQLPHQSDDALAPGIAGHEVSCWGWNGGRFYQRDPCKPGTKGCRTPRPDSSRLARRWRSGAPRRSNVDPAPAS